MNEKNKNTRGNIPDMSKILRALKELKDGSSPVEAIASIDTTSKPLSTNKAKTIGNGIGALLKKAAPTLAGFIPGVGPIASTLLSTMNDDEWFEQYKSAGLSFNELLVTKAYPKVGKAKLRVEPRAAIAAIATDVALDTPAVQEVVGPQMLAYIRMKTNNVLIDEPQQYYDAISLAAKMYAAYYTIERNLMLSQKQPLNIPNITGLIKQIDPLSINKLVGVRDALKNYLQSTVRLPYALVEAIRWRFGTVFHAFNTGQPGLIMYDLFTTVGPTHEKDELLFRIDETVNSVADAAARLQSESVKYGRAFSDLKLAYDNHAIRYDVEAPHYDEKEFNLRHNITKPASNYAERHVINLIKDSRLAMSPAIQALTLSTITQGTSLALFPVESQRIFYYWVKPETEPGAEELKTLRLIARPLVGHATGWVPSGWKETIAPVNFDFTGDGAGNIVIRNNNNHGNHYFLVQALGQSLGFYNKPGEITFTSAGSPVDSVEWSATHIAYDKATVSAEQVRSIQTAALRNLTRGDYSAKKPLNELPQQVKEASMSMVEVLK